MKKGVNSYAFIAMAGILWSTLGLFGNILMERGLSSEQVAFTRLFIGFIVLSLYSLIRRPEVLKINLKGLLYCGAIGIICQGLFNKCYFKAVEVTGVSIAAVLIRRPEVLKINLKGLLYCGAIGIICQGLFNKCYFKAVEVTGVSIAAVLLYTSPLFLAVFSKIVYKEKMTRAKIISLILCCIGAIMAVTGGVLDLEGINTYGFLAVFSKIVYKEKMTRAKIISLILCCIGAIMAVTGGVLDLEGINTYGIIMGIMAAITYALMPIISKNALKEFSSETILIYGFLFGAMFMIPSAKPVEMMGFVTNMNVLPYMILLGVFPAAMAYIFYAEGIARGCELSIVGVVASVELIAASIIGWAVVGEVFTIGKAIGVAIMFISAFTAVAGNKEVETESVEEMEAEAYVG